MTGPGGDPALQTRFEVVLDGVDIGPFTAVEGLVVEYEVEEVKEGGLNDYTHRLPGRRKYVPIKLTRPVDGNSGKIAAYFARVGTTFEPGTGKISCWNGQFSDEPVAVWTLQGVWPLKYTGPQLSAGGSAVATESLELAHTGFRLQGS